MTETCPRAWVIEDNVFKGEPPGIAFARSAGKARAIAVRSAHDAGFALKWTDVRVRRSHEFDAIAPQLEGRYYAIDYARMVLSGQYR